MPGLGRHIWYIPGSEYASPSSEEAELPDTDSQSSTSSEVSEVSLGPPSGPKGLGFNIYDAYLHVARISNPSYYPHLHDMDPWNELGETLKDLRRHGSDVLEFWQMFSEYTYTWSVISIGANGKEPLLLILQYEVIPLARWKRVHDDPSARDTRGVEMVLEQWRALSDYVVEVEVCSKWESRLMVGRRNRDRDNTFDR
jgi:hypothetical protein